ncbi:MAG: ATP-binding cassette domain-containing protein [Proteobacteria bacterium]|nr:ATP-binding cassette domain-containing protein [Pseudomonadota bacterium]
MSIELDFGQQGLSTHARAKLQRRLEQVRQSLVEMLTLDPALASRPILFHARYETVDARVARHHAADDLMQDMLGGDVAGAASQRPSFSADAGTLEVRVPSRLQNPAVIERLMVGQLLHVGLKIPPGISIRFLLDGVLMALAAHEGRPHRRGRVDLPLLSFLSARGPDGEPRALQPFLGGHCAPEERPAYLAVAASFVTFLLTQYGPQRLGVFASNLKPQAPSEASRAAYGKPFHALQTEWDSWAHAVQGRPLSVPGFVAKGLALYVRERREAVIAAAAMLPQLVYVLLMPVGLSILFDAGILKGDAAIITRTLIWLALGYAVSAIGGIAQDYATSIAAARAMVGLRETLFVKTQKLADEVLQQTESGQLTATFSSDLMLIETVVTRILPNLLFRVALLVGSVTIAFAMEWRMALAAIIFLPAAFIAPRGLARIASRAAYERKTEDAKLAGLVQENVALSRPIRVFQLQQNRLDAFRDVLGDLDRISERANIFAALAGRFTNIGASFVQLLVIGMGAVLSVHGVISAGVVIAFIGLLLNMGGAIAVLADAIPLLIQSVGAWQRVDMLLDAPLSREAEAAVPAGGWQGVDSSIAFQNVVFNYRGGEPVLDRISFEIRMGEAVAFVGPSGSGKSTILNLIQRHLDATDGQILLDGTPIGAIAGVDLRRRMATVAQENPLFNLSVRENIRLARPEATDEDIVAAARAAEIDDGIRHMPQGYDTLVGEGGGHMSGGQRQRIAIARALLRNPSVLILDEATSALDPASQNAINATLAKLRPGRMILAVTHHLSEAAEMDRIVVLRQGRVAETGDHASLLARRGVYAEMWANQNGLTISDDGRTLGITPDRLRAIGFFAHLPQEQLAALAAAMQSATVAPGDILLREGKRPDTFFILVRGTAAGSIRGLDGRQAITRRLQPGDTCGEFALLPDMIQVETTTASSACAVLTLRRDAFLRVFRGEAGLRAETEAAIAAQLEAKLDRLVDGAAGPGGALREAQREPV